MKIPESKVARLDEPVRYAKEERSLVLSFDVESKHRQHMSDVLDFLRKYWDALNDRSQTSSLEVMEPPSLSIDLLPGWTVRNVKHIVSINVDPGELECGERHFVVRSRPPKVHATLILRVPEDAQPLI